MNTKLYKIIICTCLVLLASCDDYLDLKPKGVVIPEKCEDYESLLNYAQLMKASEAYPNFMTDDVFLPYDDDMTGGVYSIRIASTTIVYF